MYSVCLCVFMCLLQVFVDLCVFDVCLRVFMCVYVCLCLFMTVCLCVYVCFMRVLVCFGVF